MRNWRASTIPTALLLLAAFTAFFLFYPFIMNGSLTLQEYLRSSHNRLRQNDDTELTIQMLVQQRNGLSKLLNEAIKQYNQLQCIMAGNITSASGRGGWCNTALMSQHMTDGNLIGGLRKVLGNKTVASFGDGPGNYKTYLMNFTSLYDAFDGSPFIENVTKQHVKHLDLSVPQYGLPLYDWVMSLEVAEHIPPEFEDIFLGNVVRHAREGVVLSWGTPGQGGFSHVNGRTLAYIEEKMKALCFVRDAELSIFLRNSSTWNFSWFRSNINVFKRQLCPLSDMMA